MSAEELTERCESADLVLPVYAYVHSGTWFSLGQQYPFNCQWDAGQCGAIVLDRKTFEKEIGRKLEEAAHEICAQVLSNYSDWCNGAVYGFTRYTEVKCDLGHMHKDEADACGGFIGDLYDSGLLENAGITNGKPRELHPDWEEVS